jgi:hypothetical protein
MTANSSKSASMFFVSLIAATVLSLTAPMAAPLYISSRSSLIRMDDIRQTRVSNVVESNRPDFQCSFEIPKKGIAEYGECQMKFKPLLATVPIACAICNMVKLL